MERDAGQKRPLGDDIAWFSGERMVAMFPVSVSIWRLNIQHRNDGFVTVSLKNTIASRAEILLTSPRYNYLP